MGRFGLKQLYYRPDRVRRPTTQLPAAALTEALGWCDDRHDFHYNRLVRLPFMPAHENLWRGDHAYDIMITTSHNQRPRIRGGGSAIFFHLTDGKNGTEGCIALSPKHMKLVLQRCSRHTQLVI
jgi:L,D-peptidoglycan transpeptidase YkuD (ErfK/YbiS/YcfS/YnhG family)